MKKTMALLVLIAVVLIIPNNIYASDDLSVVKWQVDAELLENGDLTISEDINYDFKDKFNGIFRDIVLDGHDGLENLQIFRLDGEQEIEYLEDPKAKKGQDGVYKLESKKNSLNLMIFSPSKNQEKTFRFKYSLKNIARRHQDTGELYFKFIGRENETPIADFQANILLPRFDKQDIKIFAHGPLNGSINFSNDPSIKVQVQDVSAGQFVEARILFPKDYIAKASRTGNSTLAEILNEERNLSQKIKVDTIRKENRRVLFNQISIVLSGFTGLLLLSLYRRFRRKSSLYENLTYMDLDDISPAELATFMNFAPDTRTFLASLFDLARREFITIEELEIEGRKGSKTNKDQEFLFTRKNNLEKLLDFEVFLLNWLFNDMGDGQRVSTFDMEDYRENSSLDYYKKYSKLNKMISQQLKTREYYDSGSKTTGIWLMIFSFILMVVAAIGLVYQAQYSIGLLVLGLILLIASIFLSQRRSNKGYMQKKLWENFKKDFSASNSIDYLDRDRVLIYAIALGLTMEELDDYRTTIAPSYYPIYWGHYYFMRNPSGGSQLEDKFNQGFQGNTAMSTDKSFGGGGGFTGGGGGGAGGGGTGGF